MANRTKYEKENKHIQKKWKINTNHKKFKIISTAIKKDNININGTEIEYSNKGKVLGVIIGCTGTGSHIKDSNKREKSINRALFI